MGTNIIPDDFNWEKVYLDVTQQIFEGSNKENIDFTIFSLQESNTPTIPSPYISSEIVNWFGKSLFVSMTQVNFLLETTDWLYVTYNTSVKINLETQNFENGEWVSDFTETIYSKTGTAYSKYTLYINNSAMADETILIGDTQTAYSLPTNELFTRSCYVGNSRLGTYVANEIVSNYSSGKETATVLCSISNYYDEDGNQVKFDDGDNMVFEIYDVVIPMKYVVGDNDFVDIPISQTENQTPKSFVVIGVEIFYDGAVWQKLTLQEL